MEAAEYLWDTQLRDIPEDIIRKALHEVPKRFPTWVPEVGEFWNVCNEHIQSGKYKWADEVLKAQGDFRRAPNPQHEQIISLGAKIIEKLQKLFPELQIEYKKGFKPKSSYKSAMMLTHIKNKLRSFFPEYDEATRMNWLLKNDDQCYIDLVEDFKF